MPRLILLQTEPATPNQILWHMLRTVALLTLGICVLTALLNHLGGSNPLVTFLYHSIAPSLKYLLIYGGVLSAPVAKPVLAAMACLLALLLLWPLSLIRLLMRTYLLHPAQPGAARRWLGWVAFGTVSLAFIRFTPLTTENDYTALLRFSVMLTGGALVLMALLMSYLRRDRRPALVVIDSPKPTALKLVPLAQTAPKLASIGLPRSLLVALVAELIQFCGQNKKLPSPAELADRLLPLQRAAQASASGSFGSIELEDLCTRALILLETGQLGPLTSLKAAVTLYRTPSTTHMDAIVDALARQISP